MQNTLPGHNKQKRYKTAISNITGLILEGEMAGWHHGLDGCEYK